MKKCKTEGCNNQARKDSNYCYTCVIRRVRAKNPVKYIYNNLKFNAKRRGKEFTLTYEQFEQFCIETGYDKNRGQTPTSMSIDRIDNNRGYSIDNIRSITLSENSSLRDKVKADLPQNEENCPF